MKAALLQDYGGPENFQIADVPAPMPAAGEVLVKIEFAGLRWGDIMGRRGVPARLRTPPFVPGQEAAGVVEDIGDGVSRFAPGDRVYCLPQGGAYQEYLAISERALRRVPDRVSLEQMSDLPGQHAHGIHGCV